MRTSRPIRPARLPALRREHLSHALALETVDAIAVARCADALPRRQAPAARPGAERHDASCRVELGPEQPVHRLARLRPGSVRVRRPDARIGGGLGIVFYRPPTLKNADTVDMRRPPPSVGIGGFYTSQADWGAVGGVYRPWAKDRYRYLGIIGGGLAGLNYFGVRDSPFQHNPLDYNFYPVGTLQRVQARVLDFPLYVGAEYVFVHTRSLFDSALRLPVELAGHEQKIDMGGSGRQPRLRHAQQLPRRDDGGGSLGEGHRLRALARGFRRIRPLQRLRARLCAAEEHVGVRRPPRSDERVGRHPVLLRPVHRHARAAGAEVLRPGDDARRGRGAHDRAHALDRDRVRRHRQCGERVERALERAASPGVAASGSAICWRRSSASDPGWTSRSAPGASRCSTSRTARPGNDASSGGCACAHHHQGDAVLVAPVLSSASAYPFDAAPFGWLWNAQQWHSADPSALRRRAVVLALVAWLPLVRR